MALSYFQESLRHAVIDLQTQTDEKALIGKLHRQIVSMQSKENENAQKMATLETKMARWELAQNHFQVNQQHIFNLLNAGELQMICSTYAKRIKLKMFISNTKLRSADWSICSSINPEAVWLYVDIWHKNLFFGQHVIQLIIWSTVLSYL